MIIVTLLCVQVSWSQENTEDTSITRDTFVEGFIEVAYIQPIFYGNNFISEGYDVKSTINIGLTKGIEFMVLHVDLNIASSDVVRPDLVGNVRDANFTRVSAGVGYPLDINSRWQFLPSLNIGYLKIGQLFRDEKIRDDGFFINAEVALNYRVFKWGDISLGAQNYFDFISIDAPSEIQSFFNNAQSIYPFLGFRFRIAE
ncbi:hypothetical protein [uncultured Dokdonia sp.]|uniref:hypothetical protein n=1 Tax=uncultured Dokdonia sp. TaxID=575653 RepID=UPI002630399F|nr:hypothetical protein [uncultured Dokdonia sp.]